MTARKQLIEKLLNKDEPITYSSVMRTITNHFSSDTVVFMQAFKQSFLEAKDEKIEDAEKIAIMDALQSLSCDTTKIKTSNYIETIIIMKIGDAKK